MVAPDARTTILPAGAVALIVAGIAGLAVLGEDIEPPREPSSVPIETPGAVTDVAAREPRLPGARPAAVDTWSPDDAIDTVALRYREAGDVRGFYQRAAETGGMAHLWFAQTALLRCSQVIRLGMVGAEQQFASLGASDEIDATRREAHRSWIGPCRGFETRPLLPGEMQRLHARLRDSPGLVGEAYRIALRREASAAEHRQLLRSIVESGDPHLIGVFGPGVADIRFGPWRYESDPAALDANRRLIAEQRAWMLAGCELGMDCGRGSLTWYNACVKSGDCSEANAASEAAAEAGREALPGILRRKDELVAAIRAGDWGTLGL